MVDQQTIVDGIKRGLLASGALDGVMTGQDIVTEPLDLVGEDADIDMPAMEIFVGDKHRQDSSDDYDAIVYEDDTEKGWTLNEDESPTGKELGYIYTSYYRMTAQVNIWNASSFEGRNVTNIGQAVETALRAYDTGQFGWPLPHPDPIDSGQDYIKDIGTFTVDNFERDDLITHTRERGNTPSIRRWMGQVEIFYEDSVNTFVEYGPIESIQNVRHPQYGDFRTSSTDSELEADPADG